MKNSYAIFFTVIIVVLSLILALYIMQRLGVEMRVFDFRKFKLPEFNYRKYDLKFMG